MKKHLLILLSFFFLLGCASKPLPLPTRLEAPSLTRESNKAEEIQALALRTSEAFKMGHYVLVGDLVEEILMESRVLSVLLQNKTGQIKAFEEKVFEQKKLLDLYVDRNGKLSMKLLNEKEKSSYWKSKALWTWSILGMVTAFLGVLAFFVFKFGLVGKFLSVLVLVFSLSNATGFSFSFPRGTAHGDNKEKANSVAFVEKDRGRLVLDILMVYLGQRETKGANRSPFIDKINKIAKAPLGSPWCGSFCGFGYYEADCALGEEYPKLYAAARKWFPKNKRINPRDAKAGDLMGIYFLSKGAIRHIEVVIKVEGGVVFTLGGNTNSRGSREGDGVYLKKRKITKNIMFARWI